MEFFLIRAGSTQWDEYRRLQGRLQVPLSEEGTAQVQRGVQIGGLEAVRGIHSGFTLSAMQTAQLASNILGRPLKRSGELDEVGLGMWQGILESDLKRRHRRLHALWRRSPFAVIPPQGEPLEDAWERITEAIEEITSGRGGPAAIVLPRMAHRLAECWLRYGSPDRFFESEDHGFACEKYAI